MSFFSKLFGRKTAAPEKSPNDEGKRDAATSGATATPEPKSPANPPSLANVTTKETPKEAAPVLVPSAWKAPAIPAAKKANAVGSSASATMKAESDARKESAPPPAPPPKMSAMESATAPTLVTAKPPRAASQVAAERAHVPSVRESAPEKRSAVSPVDLTGPTAVAAPSARAFALDALGALDAEAEESGPGPDELQDTIIDMRAVTVSRSSGGGAGTQLHAKDDSSALPPYLLGGAIEAGAKGPTALPARPNASASTDNKAHDNVLAVSPFADGPDSGGIDGLFQELEAAVDAFSEHHDAKPAPEMIDATSHREVVELFEKIAAQYMTQVREFVLELTFGDAPRQWVDICSAPLRAIESAAMQMGQTELYTLLGGFRSWLEEVEKSGEPMIAGELRDELLLQYALMTDLFPQLFTLGTERKRREPIIVHSLLLQIPGVRKVTIDHLYAAGITTLETIQKAKPQDMAATAGIPLALAGEISARFAAYHAERVAMTPDATRSSERTKLAGLARELRKQQDEFVALADADDRAASARRRELRNARETTLLELKLTLAQMGETGLIAEIEKCPIVEKIARLAAYLEHAESEAEALRG